LSTTECALPTTLLGAVLWRRLDEPSFDHCRVHEFPGGYLLAGRVLTVVDGQPAEVHYSAHCEPDWTTRETHIMVAQATRSRELRLRRDDAYHWWRDEQRVPEFDGLLDVDLSVTPATNTFPIRRMALPVGESRSAAALWVRFPELSVEPLPQRYTRLDQRRYRYESDNGAFTTEIVVDDVGLVVRYGDMWERLASSA
jgi:hypothetical protein